MSAIAMQPPAMRGGVPFLGHLTDFFKDPVGLLRRGYQEHGPIYSFRMGGRNLVVMLGPDNNRFVFQETDKLLSIRRERFLSRRTRAIWRSEVCLKSCSISGR